MNSTDKFLKAIKKGDTERIGEILQDPGFNVNDYDPKSGNTLIQVAMENDQYETFKLLLSHKSINLNQLSREGSSCLETAILMNSIEYVSAVLAKYKNQKQKNAKGQSILEIAIKNQVNPEIIKKLIHHHYDINEQPTGYGSLLNLAVMCNSFDNFQCLLGQQTIQIRSVDDYGNNCLMLAVSEKRGDFVVAIFEKIDNSNILSDIEKQFFINSQNQQGNTAIHLAAIKDHQTILDIILRYGQKYGLDKGLKNKQGRTYETIIELRKEAREKQEQNQQKRKLEKFIRHKQKEQEKIRRIKEQERIKAEEKRRKREEERILEQKMKQASEQQKSKTLWTCGIFFVVLLCLMYLLILNSIGNKPAAESFS